MDEVPFVLSISLLYDNSSKNYSKFKWKAGKVHIVGKCLDALLNVDASSLGEILYYSFCYIIILNKK